MQPFEQARDKLIVLVVMCLVAAAPALAQSVSPPPAVSAENDEWYRRGEPVTFAGAFYFRAGPAVFFNPDTMIRSGHFNGVPLYSDTTIEPYSIVLVPIGRGLMQPYERPRRGQLAGTVGSRTPSFPVETLSATRDLPMAPISPTGLPGATTVIDLNERQPAAPAPVPSASDTAPAADARPSTRPADNRPDARVVWFQYRGVKWVSAGPAVPLRAADFVKVGEYAGFPVLARQGLQEERIYLPTWNGLVAPFRVER